jgi:hypothetical protein
MRRRLNRRPLRHVESPKDYGIQLSYKGTRKLIANEGCNFDVAIAPQMRNGTLLPARLFKDGAQPANETATRRTAICVGVPFSIHIISMGYNIGTSISGW